MGKDVRSWSVRNWSYDTWSEEIARYFLHKQANHPIVLCVDEETLADLTGQDGKDSADALAQCVADRIMPDHRYWLIEEKWDRWAKGDRQAAPPSLPLLGLTVLAASHMDHSADMAPNNYYDRFRRLLDSSDRQHRMPGDYGNVIQKLWRKLEAWLNDELGGETGILVLPSEEVLLRNPARKNIGFALHQALLRASDRRRLAAFFSDIGLEPAEEDIEVTELRRVLALWARRHLPQTTRLHILADEPEYETYCLRLLQRQAEGWDGRLDDPVTGKPVASIRLLLRARPRSLGLVLARDDRMPAKTTLRPETTSKRSQSGQQVTAAGAAIELSSDISDPYFAPLPLPIEVTEKILSAGFTLTGQQMEAVLDAKPLHAFRYDEYLGGWVSQDSITFGDQHHLLVHDDELAELIRFARSEHIDISEVHRYADVLPDGWHVISRFRMASRPSGRPPGAIAALLRSGGGLRLRLVGGLKLPGFRRAYLTGGEPLLDLPADVEAERIMLTNSDRGETLPLAPQSKGSSSKGSSSKGSSQSSEYPLNKLDLPAGRYRVEYGTAQIEFDMVDGLAETAGDGAGSITTAGRTTGLSGIHGSVPHGLRPVTVRAPAVGEQCVLVGPGPKDLEIVELPVWLSDWLIDLEGGGELSWRSTAEWLSFDPVWRLVKRPESDHYRATKEKGDSPPHHGPHSGTWANLINKAIHIDPDPETYELWQQYLAAAGAIS